MRRTRRGGLPLDTTTGAWQDVIVLGHEPGMKQTNRYVVRLLRGRQKRTLALNAFNHSATLLSEVVHGGYTDTRRLHHGGVTRRSTRATTRRTNAQRGARAEESPWNPKKQPSESP